MKPTSEYAEDWRSPGRPAAAPMLVRVTAPHRARWVLHVALGFALGFGAAVLLGVL